MNFLLLIIILITILALQGNSENFSDCEMDTLDPYLYWNVYHNKTANPDIFYKDKSLCTETECQQKCLYDSDCDLYTFNKLNGKCLLGKMSKAPKVITGINRGNKGEGTRIEKNGMFKNSDKYLVDKQFEQDAFHCGLSCFRKKDCDYYTYNNNNGTCYLNKLPCQNNHVTGIRIR